jgi:hypothetical protein
MSSEDSIKDDVLKQLGDQIKAVRLVVSINIYNKMCLIKCHYSTSSFLPKVPFHNCPPTNQSLRGSVCPIAWWYGHSHLKNPVVISCNCGLMFLF